MIVIVFFFLYIRFTVREFTYNEVELAAGKNEISKLVTDKKKQFVSNYTSIKIRNLIIIMSFYQGSIGTMVKSQFQRMFLCLDSCESSSCIC